MSEPMTPEQIEAVLDAHWKWLKGENGGARADLRGADLRDSDLRGADLRDSDLTGADLTRADLTGADLRDSDLTGADLTGADLRDSDLTGADLRGADLREITPHITVPSLHRRILAAIEGGGRLEMSNWHSCKTTHCRAGWNVTLAGPAGAVLEACLGQATAGALIAVASCPALKGKVPNFYASNKKALEDIRRLALLEPEIEQPPSQPGAENNEPELQPASASQWQEQATRAVETVGPP